MISSSDPEEDFPLLVLKRTFSISFLNHQLDYSLLEPMDGGCAPETELFVFVPTRPEAFYLRQKIRESWAANLVGKANSHGFDHNKCVFFSRPT
jgi:hypothetical protein